MYHGVNGLMGSFLQVIDPFEELNPDKWPTQQVRLQLIEECRLNSLGPFFVVMHACLSCPTQYKSENIFCQLMHVHLIDVVSKFSYLYKLFFILTMLTV